MALVNEYNDAIIAEMVKADETRAEATPKKPEKKQQTDKEYVQAELERMINWFYNTYQMEERLTGGSMGSPSPRSLNQRHS